jgi:hypothetical protein
MSASNSNANATDLPDKSRRKNCNACVWSKRRCDKRTPRCTRCAEKGFPCVYQSLLPSSSSSAAASAAADTSAGPADQPLHAVDLGGGSVPTPPQPFDFNDFDNSHPVSASGTCPDVTLDINESDQSNTTSALSSIGLDLNANTMFDFGSVLIADSMQDNNNMQPWEMQQAPVVSKSLAPELTEQVGYVCCKRDEILVSTLTLSSLSHSPHSLGIIDNT